MIRFFLLIFLIQTTQGQNLENSNTSPVHILGTIEKINKPSEINSGFDLSWVKNLKLLLEPACVAGFAALKKLNSSKFIGQNTLLILCGSNIDYQSWNKLVTN